MRARLSSDAGQAFVFVVAVLAVLVGMAALVIDGGAWYRAQRHLQTAVDAAALAGAQELPTKPTTAVSVALDFGTARNGSGLRKLTVTPTVTKPYELTVDATAKPVGILAPVLGEVFEEVTVRAHAKAAVFAPSKLKDVAPIAVHTSMACIVTDPSCFGQTKTLTLVEESEYDPTKSKFGLLDLDRDGNAGAGDMKDWLEDGYSDFLPINTDYPPANGEKNGINKQLEDASDAERTLLFPVYDTADEETGYHVIGWAAFVIDDVVNWSGKNHELTGHFVTFIATALAAGNPLTDPSLDFGVHVITLTA
jgi:hypothetical protein